MIRIIHGTLLVNKSVFIKVTGIWALHFNRIVYFECYRITKQTSQSDSSMQRSPMKHWLKRKRGIKGCWGRCKQGYTTFIHVMVVKAHFGDSKPIQKAILVKYSLTKLCLNSTCGVHGFLCPQVGRGHSGSLLSNLSLRCECSRFQQEDIPPRSLLGFVEV